MDQYIGKLLDNRYEILERIGIGGMAVVYKARCHRLNRLVAVKILKEDLAQDAEFRRRFHDESQAVAMLSHPNIVAVYDVSRSQELDYIVMELIDGISLKQYMQKRGGKLSWREALHFITQIMKALSHAHSRGIIHRDIKPHNMMVLRDGSLKVADFGIARVTSAAQATLTQEALGSVHYISPEQARGSRIDARSDIYSAGVVLYEMITGRLPYEGESPVSVAIQHINSIPLSPRELDPEIPEALEAITMKAMASDVSQRYISADAMLADLEEFRKNPSINFDYTPADLTAGDGDEPTHVIGANTPHTARQPSARRPREENQSSQQARRRPRPPEDSYYEDDDRGGSRLPMVLAVVAIVIFLAGMGYFLWVSFFSGLIGGAQPVKNYHVPLLTGLTVTEAQSRSDVIEAQFQIAEGGTMDSALPAGQIASQEPGSGLNAAAGSTITVILSNGSGVTEPDPEIMPDLFNTDYRSAQAVLRQLGYSQEAGNLILEEEPSDEITKEYVIRQTPASKTPMDGVTSVTLVVSTGPDSKPVTVINFVTMLEADARRAAEALKLKVTVSEAYDPEIAEGRICYQSIKPDTEVEEGQTISLRVSKGPDPATSPTPEPTPEPTPGPPPTPKPASPTPPPRPAAPPASVPVELPDDGRETVTVRILVGDKEAYNQPVNTVLGRVSIPVSGTGMQTITVYIDGSLLKTMNHNFNP